MHSLNSFTPDGRYIISRDYLSIKVWDIYNERRPLTTIAINERLRPMLSELYESDYVFDKFELAVSIDGNKVLTGNYGY